ncbi:hypothetical protein N6L26_12120 [Qipengyuania sp. SS22]|uniref:hypothetical protein n=1 Tax=Qipengyuania sp. SS22 TaxID=2979461 RepID=UPI0021E5797C|nr:hypothetical protein [Qipengyuania sp. SS22]UYH54774.1 hypothetical protein N6L26_12120 [Qipengyuania sp. SS22]
MHIAQLSLPLAVLALSACVPAPGPAANAAASPQEAFWQALSSHCGKAYAGGLASTDARDADWADKRMVAHWADCEEDRVAIAFHVEEAPPSSGSEAVRRTETSSSSEAVGREQSWNRSRTWIVTREGTGADTRFTLKHDHRHADGEADAVSFYGGTSADAGSAAAQDFPLDAESVALFEREGLAASLTNVWRIEVTPRGSADARFAYQLTRRNDPTRLFRVEIDASAPVDAPPAAWGW